MPVMGNKIKLVIFSASGISLVCGCSIVNVYHQGEQTDSYLSVGTYQADTDQDIAIQTRGFGLVPTQSGWTLGYVEEAYASIRDVRACRLIVFDDDATSISALSNLHESIEVKNDDFIQ